MYPGDSYVDVLEFEIYNFSVGATPFVYHTNSGSINAYNEICALSASKKVVLSELGTYRGNPALTPSFCLNMKSYWISQVMNPSILKAIYPRLSGLIYWDDPTVQNVAGFSTKWDLKETTTTQASAIAAFKLADYKNGQ